MYVAIVQGLKWLILTIKSNPIRIGDFNEGRDTVDTFCNTQICSFVCLTYPQVSHQSNFIFLININK